MIINMKCKRNVRHQYTKDKIYQAVLSTTKRLVLVNDAGISQSWDLKQWQEFFEETTK